MKSIFGRINANHQAIDPTLFIKSMERLCVFSDYETKTLLKSFWGLGQLIFPNRDYLSFDNQDLKIVSDSVIYNKPELEKRLGLSFGSANDDLVILEAYKKWGKDCVLNLIGDFAFAIWDDAKGELFCARDHFGVKPFNYYFDNNSFVFSTDSSAILSQTDLSFSINEKFIADSISIIKSGQSESTYNEIKKLPPAHSLFLKGGKLVVEQYWELSTQEEIKKADKEIITEFKSLLVEAVRCRTEGNSNVGSELSGGIDSSTVTALANQFGEVKTFSHVLPDDKLGKIHPFVDERKFINIITDYCKIENSSFIRSEEISLLNALTQNVSDFKGITQQNFGIFSDHLYQEAQKEGVSVLLSGFGGDEVVTSKSPGYLKELIAKEQWNELKEDLKNQNKENQYYKHLFKHKFPGLLKIYRSIKKEKVWWENKFDNLAISQNFFERLQIKSRYFQYHQKQEDASLQEKNIERVTHPHLAQRLEYCSLIARRHGVEYRYPLLDKRLIEFYLAIPIRLKVRNGIGRYIIRKAIEGIVPDEIQWRNDKTGATIPTVYMRLLKDKEAIQELIDRTKTNLIVKQFIDIEKFEKWFNNMCTRSEKKWKYINPGAFYNYLKLIIFIDQNPNVFE